MRTRKLWCFPPANLFVRNLMRITGTSRHPRLHQYSPPFKGNTGRNGIILWCSRNRWTLNAERLQVPTFSLAAARATVCMTTFSSNENAETGVLLPLRALVAGSIYSNVNSGKRNIIRQKKGNAGRSVG